jgi:osmotically-inducible protein OsmY
MNEMSMLNMNRPVLRRTAQAALVIALLGSLQGCVGLMVGGAVASVASAVDRRTLGAQADDKSIAVKADLRLPKIVGKEGHVNANSFNRQVLLTGEVKDEAMKAEVERQVRAIDGVLSVANELEVAPPSTYTSRSSDALITTKVKASLVDMKTISASSFKVVTERGVVYLMGRVTQREGQVGSDVARGVSGVNKVVKIFEYITEEEMRTLSPNTSTVAL